MGPAPKYSLGLCLGDPIGAAVLLQNWKVVAAAVEAIPRRRSLSLPLQAIQYCLNKVGPAHGADIQIVGLGSQAARDWSDFLASQYDEQKGWLGSLLALPANLRQELKFRSDLMRNLGKVREAWPTITAVAEEVALAQGIFASQAIEQMAILVLDAPFEEIGSGIWRAGAQGLESIWEQEYPQSLSLLVHNLATFCGFRGRLGQRQFLRLAEYGEARYEDIVATDLLRFGAGGRFDINLDVLVRDPHHEKDWTALSRLFNSEPRTPEQPISSREIDLAHALVKRIESWARVVAGVAVDELQCRRLLVRGHGPIFDRLKGPLSRYKADLKVSFTLKVEEPLLIATGAALQALSENGQGFIRERPLILRPDFIFERKAPFRPQLAPVPQA